MASCPAARMRRPTAGRRWLCGNIATSVALYWFTSSKAVSAMRAARRDSCWPLPVRGHHQMRARVARRQGDLSPPRRAPSGWAVEQPCLGTSARQYGGAGGPGPHLGPHQPGHPGQHRADPSKGAQVQHQCRGRAPSRPSVGQAAEHTSQRGGVSKTGISCTMPGQVPPRGFRAPEGLAVCTPRHALGPGGLGAGHP